MRAKLLTLLLCLITTAAHAAPTVGQPAPALTAPTIDGQTFDLSALKGKVVVVHYWASWCAPCREEMPALEAVWRHDHGLGLEVLAISADRPRDRNDAEQVMKYFTFPAALLNNLTKNDFGAPAAIPVTYVIDKSGVVTNILTPDTTPLTENALGDIVKNLLDAKDNPSSPRGSSATSPPSPAATLNDTTTASPKP